MSEFWFKTPALQSDPWFLHISAPNFGEGTVLPCHDTDPDAFFPENTDPQTWEVRAVKKICAGCQFQPDCLQYALEGDVPFGIWGGTTPLERKRMKKRMNRHV